MKRIGVLLSLVVVFAFPGHGRADDTLHVRAAAEKLLNLFNMEETYEKSTHQAMQMSLQFVDSQNASEEKKQLARKSIEAGMNATLEKFSWKRMKDLFIDIYAEVLTLEELQGLISFYESPIGQQFIHKQPELTAATIQKMQAMMQQVMPEIQQEISKSIDAATSGRSTEENKEAASDGGGNAQ